MKKILLLTLIIITLGCQTAEELTETTEQSPNEETPVLSGLSAYTSCGELLAELQEDALERMENSLKSYGQCYGYFEEPVMGSPSSDEEGSGVDFTDTNRQEKDVDEADIIKTNGDYIYVATDQAIDIFQAWPPEEFHKVASYSLESDDSVIFEAPTLYLAGEELILIQETNIGTLVDAKRQTQVSVIDVTNPAAPTLIRKKVIDGYLVGSRRIGDLLHLIVSHSLQDHLVYDFEYPEIDWEVQARSCSDNEREAAPAKDEIAKAVSETIEINRQRIAATSLGDWLPQHGNGEYMRLVSCTDFMKDASTGQGSLTGLLSLNISGKNSPEQITFIKGYAHQVYASTESIYLASHPPLFFDSLDVDGEIKGATDIHRFEIGTNHRFHQYIGSGNVPGYIFSSFLMGEHDSTFRIATTSRDRGSEVSNNLYVLDSEGPDLAIIGKIENIAPGEQIYAARFLGKKAYLVTFKKIDPLFVIDLADPRQPMIAGELKMPGYSTYLHPLDENHIIGLGKDAEDMGSFAWFQGLKLALFDVSADQSPVIADETIIGSRGTESAALSDHHAFTFDPESGVLALPLSLHEGGEGGSERGEFQYNGVQLFQISDANGIDLLAEIELPDTGTAPLRTTLIGDDTREVLYVMDRSKLYLVDLDDPNTIQAELDLF